MPIVETLYWSLRKVFNSRQPYSSYSFLFPLLLVLVFGIWSVPIFGSAKEVKEKGFTFSEFTLPPLSGHKPESMVILFHGYGDTAENFLFLGLSWAELLPNTLFVALDGPMACKDIPSGKKWLNASSKNHPQLCKEMNLLALSLNRYLEGLLKRYSIPPEKIAFVGFSQGMRVALHVALRHPCAGVVGFSGAFLDDPTTKLQASPPPTLLIHGLEDSRAPSSLAREAHKRLEALQVPVTLFLMPGLGHDIDPRGAGIAGEFLKECLSGKIKDRKL